MLQSAHALNVPDQAKKLADVGKCFVNYASNQTITIDGKVATTQ